MTLIGFLACGLLLSIALVHAAWAFGMHWPARNETMLIRTVIGTPGMTRMPGTGLKLGVAMMIAMAGVCALWLGGSVVLPLPGWVETVTGSVLAMVFAVRGLATYLGVLFAAGPLTGRTEPFATLDRSLYAPLCLLLALGFGILTFAEAGAQWAFSIDAVG